MQEAEVRSGPPIPWDAFGDIIPCPRIQVCLSLALHPGREKIRKVKVGGAKEGEQIAQRAQGTLYQDQGLHPQKKIENRMTFPTMSATGSPPPHPPTEMMSSSQAPLPN